MSKFQPCICYFMATLMSAKILTPRSLSCSVFSTKLHTYIEVLPKEYPEFLVTLNSKYTRNYGLPNINVFLFVIFINSWRIFMRRKLLT